MTTDDGTKAGLNAINSEDCPYSSWHNTHHYCPHCNYASDTDIKRKPLLPKKQIGLISMNREEEDKFVNGLDMFMYHINTNAKLKGFWPDHPSMQDGNEKLLLIHAEVSEVVEERRHKDYPRPASKIADFTAEEEELADVLIRLLDFAAQNKLDIAGAALAKHAYNTNRPYKHGKTF